VRIGPQATASNKTEVGSESRTDQPPRRMDAVRRLHAKLPQISGRPGIAFTSKNAQSAALGIKVSAGLRATVELLEAALPFSFSSFVRSASPSGRPRAHPFSLDESSRGRGARRAFVLARRGWQ